MYVCTYIRMWGVRRYEGYEVKGYVHMWDTCEEI